MSPYELVLNVVGELENISGRGGEGLLVPVVCMCSCQLPSICICISVCLKDSRSRL